MTRDFSNKNRYTASNYSGLFDNAIRRKGLLGNWWTSTGLPLLTRAPGRLVMASHGIGQVRNFRHHPATDTYTLLPFQAETLVHDAAAQELIWTDQSGTQRIFHDFTEHYAGQPLAFAPELRGQFKRQVDEAGNVTTVSRVQPIAITCGVTKGSSTVTGSGFDANWVGSRFRIGTANLYTITSATTTALTLNKVYEGATNPSAPGYVLSPDVYKVVEVIHSNAVTVAVGDPIHTESWLHEWIPATIKPTVGVANGSPTVTGAGFSRSWLGGTFKVGSGTSFTIVGVTPTTLTLGNASSVIGYDAATAPSIEATITPGGTGQLAAVTLRRQVGGGAWTIVRRVEYAYYGTDHSRGNIGDLAFVNVIDPAGQIIDTSHFRYYSRFAMADINWGGLKYTLNPQAYARAKQALGGSDAAVWYGAVTDPDPNPNVVGPCIELYADRAYTWDGKIRVASVVVHDSSCSCGTVSDGLHSYTYTQTAVAGADCQNPNHWWMKTVETRPDGNQTTYFTNRTGWLLLKVITDVTSGQQWRWFHRYDNAGRRILVADPSATLGYDETLADLGFSGNSIYLADNVGLIHVTTYGASTTATAGTAGNVLGYVQSHGSQQGELGTVIPERALTYYARSGNGITIYPKATTTRYRNNNGTGSQTTTMTYTWWGASVQPYSIQTTFPIVTTAQNGSNAATAMTDWFDAYGRPIWHRDEDGFITYRAYDVPTGALVKRIDDVKTTLTADFTALPGGLATPAGGGLHLIQQMVVDAFGRWTRSTDPKGRVDYRFFDDVAHAVRTYPAWSGTATTGPIQITREDRPNSYIERLTLAVAAPAQSGGVPLGTDAITSAGLRSLTRTQLDVGNRPIAEDTYVNFTGVTYATTPTLGALNTAYYRKDYFYDKRGLVERVKSEDGSIRRSVSDVRGRVISEWIGTNDTPASGFWSPSNNTAPSNMVKVAERHYDFDGTGNGTLTSSIAFAADATSYTTQYRYDFRNRRTQSRGPDKVATTMTLDNLGQATVTETFADADSDFVIDANERRGKEESFFDEKGQLYQQAAYQVDPVTGTVGNKLVTNRWLNARGLVAKVRSPNGAFTKTIYDGAGRAIRASLSYDDAETLYADALTRANDTVIEQSATIFDAASNPVTTTT